MKKDIDGNLLTLTEGRIIRHQADLYVREQTAA